MRANLKFDAQNLLAVLDVTHAQEQLAKRYHNIPRPSFANYIDQSYWLSPFYSARFDNLVGHQSRIVSVIMAQQMFRQQEDRQ